MNAQSPGFQSQCHIKQEGWHTLIIPVLGRRRQVEHKFKVNPSYTGTLRMAWARDSVLMYTKRSKGGNWERQRRAESQQLSVDSKIPRTEQARTHIGFSASGRL